jgi:nucleoside-diphosphate-sugar epimerase
VPGQPHPGPLVAVTGSEDELGRRVGEALQGRADVRALDPQAGELVAQLRGVTCLVHLAPDPPERPALNLDGARAEAAVVRRLLEAATDAGVEAVVLLSSAVVHGAWPDNPVPLTESASVRPVPGFPFAARCAEVERLAGAWAVAGSRRAAALRPAPVVGAGPGLAAALRLGWPVRWGEDEPPVQLLHVDDLATAVALAATEPLDGPYGVAPDGWVDPAAVRALAGSPPAVPVPGRVRAALARRSLGDVPPGILAHAAHPWVVANDRLRAAGWAPSSTSEEAYVATHAGAPWSRITPRRRQDLILGAAATALVGLPVAAAAAVRRRRRRRSG